SKEYFLEEGSLFMQEEHHHHTSCVRLVPIFNHLDANSMSKIGERAQSRKVKAGEYVYQEGDQASSIYIVHSGQLRIFHLSENGKEQLIRVLAPGDFTGEGTIFSTAAYHEHYA